MMSRINKLPELSLYILFILNSKLLLNSMATPLELDLNELKKALHPHCVCIKFSSFSKK